MEDIFGPVLVCLILFIGLPWIVFHYITKWKQAPKITVEDEQLLDDMFNLARRLEERLITVERIAAADHPDWKPGLNAPTPEWQGSLNAPHSTYPVDRRN
ncbi:envelope stress response membrane protein PspB [Sphingomonas sp.]|jgi:phage shock protein B|uniref:envelope stress response membrane protein PspB n=1 Tax=Sphingomonas sp. TaxID=28214 RepID=UPI002D80880F|nr:envelope stress response membrane protein PspB [Sphingomonas sp.]HEU0043551.1 envelope stress response membrane protein PspB [Sphingomonas sp.]